MRTILRALALAALASGPAIADDARPPAAKATPAKAPRRQVTIVQLGAMLENLGYELTPLKDDKGETTGWDTTLTSEGWTLHPRFAVSPSGMFVWVTGTVAKGVDLADVPKDALVALLADNKASGPAHVYYDAGDRAFVLAVATLNADLTPADLRLAVELFTVGTKKALGSWQAATRAGDAAKGTLTKGD